MGRQSNRWVDRQTVGWRGKQMGGQSNRWVDRQTDGWTGRHINGRTDEQTSRETDHSINNFLEVVNKADMVGKKTSR
jgi:hypothetical protein